MIYSAVQCMVYSPIDGTIGTLCPESDLICGQIQAAIVWTYTGVVWGLYQVGLFHTSFCEAFGAIFGS